MDESLRIPPTRGTGSQHELDARDAARYRWLRDHANDPVKGKRRDPMVFRCLPGTDFSWSDALTGAELDEALDMLLGDRPAE